MIAPIQTAYDGRLFRSRIEARYHVFFKALNIESHYEPEGLEVTIDGKIKKRYLPDFYLPKVIYRNTTQRGWYIEIKPDGTYNDKLDLVCAELKMPGLLLSGYSVRANNHYQHGEHRDDSMNFRKCEDCQEVLIGYGHKNARCPICGGYCCDKEPIDAANYANSFRFEFGHDNVWPRQPQTDQAHPF